MYFADMLRTVNVIRYVTPLREGGSLPAIVEADDEFMYVLKFRGAGQGPKALIAEFIGGEIARSIGLKIPELVFAILAEGFGRTERDEEIQDLLKFSVGLNLGLHYLSGAISFDPTVHQVDPLLASKIVWLDALLMNVDRTAKNTNMLYWHKTLWLIDHGASLYFHHGHPDWAQRASQPFLQIRDHVLLRYATQMEAAGEWGLHHIAEDMLHTIIRAIPDDWLTGDIPADMIRAQYVAYFRQRLAWSQTFIKEINDVRKSRF